MLIFPELALIIRIPEKISSYIGILFRIPEKFASSICGPNFSRNLNISHSFFNSLFSSETKPFHFLFSFCISKELPSSFRLRLDRTINREMVICFHLKYHSFSSAFDPFNRFQILHFPTRRLFLNESISFTGLSSSRCPFISGRYWVSGSFLFIVRWTREHFLPDFN